MKLTGRIAVVTGASRGIGLAIAELFRREGARVAGCARKAVPAAEIEACDVQVASDVARFAASVKKRLGDPDIVVNNAGTVVRARLDVLEEDDWDEVVGSNLKGTFLVTRAFLPGMRARGRGRVINVASISGRLGTPGLTAYCSAKHGVVGFTRALAEETRDEGLQVNAICPGSVDTDMLKIGMPGAEPKMTTEDIARVALFLAADAPSALTGSCVDVFG